MGRASSLILGGIACGVALAAGCSRSAPQLVVVIDTDIVLPRQLAANSALSPGASFDRLKIEMLEEKGESIGISADTVGGSSIDVERTVLVTATTPWPVTFGVRASESGYRDARIRIRAYRQDSVSYLVGAGRVDERLVLDRLVKLTVPEEGTVTARVVLAGDCFGTPSDPTTSFQTCITSPSDMRDASEGIEQLATPVLTTVSGSWPSAQPTPCTTTKPNDDAACIPSGVFVRGDENFEDSVGDSVSSLRRHLVHLRPFYLDRHELTVGRFRELFARGISGITAPTRRSSEDPLCTWSDTAADLEARPLNCVSQALARAICKAEGGDLPTDAQWELAARGRRIAPYVWGDQPAACCAAWIGGGDGCNHDAPTDVGAATDPTRCDGRADVSPDGILDLAGNVRELVRDSAVFYKSSDCPQAGILEDPVCVVARTKQLARGGSFRSSFDQAKIAARRTAEIADDVGFRCAYAGGAP